MSEKRTWKKLESKVAYETPWMKIIEDKIIRPDDKESIYSYMDGKNGVDIIAQDYDSGIYFVEQIRYPPNEVFYELPGGHMESNDPLEDAKKELLEETGIEAAMWEDLGKIYPLPSHLKFYCNVFLARDLNKENIGIQHQEGDEAIIEIKKFSISEIKHMIKTNQITSGITLSSLLKLFTSSLT